MELFGITLTLWNCLMAWTAVVVTYILYDWFTVLAWGWKYNIKGPIPLPIIGTFYTMIGTKNFDELDRKMLRKYGPVVGTHLGAIKCIHIADVDLLKKIFIKDHNLFQNRYTLDCLEQPPMDEGLMNLKDNDWKRVRSIVTPTFSPGKLKLMTAEINFCSDLLAKSFMDCVKLGKPADIRHHFGCYTMDVIAGTAFGIRTFSYTRQDQPFVYHAEQVSGEGVLNNPWLLMAFFFPRLCTFLVKYCGCSFFYPPKSISFFSDVISKVMENRKETRQEVRPDLIGLLMNAHENADGEIKQTAKNLSRNEVTAMGFFAFVAGYDEVTSFLSFLAYALAIHPEVQDRVIEEIDARFTNDEVEVNYEDMPEMTYLDQVVYETLRMYPPLLRMNRSTSIDKDVYLDGYFFPRDTLLEYSIWQVHNDLGLYEEPELFRPERFAPEEKRKRDTVSFLSFGLGPRNCIGMRLALLESKIAIIHILKQMRFVKCDETEVPIELVKETFLRPKRPIKLGVELRTAVKD